MTGGLEVLLLGDVEARRGGSTITLAGTKLQAVVALLAPWFVRTKLALERLAVGDILRIRLRDGEPKRNVPQAVRDHGHEIISLSPVTDDLYELTIRKRR